MRGNACQARDRRAPTDTRSQGFPHTRRAGAGRPPHPLVNGSRTAVAFQLGVLALIGHDLTLDVIHNPGVDRHVRRHPEPTPETHQPRYRSQSV